jgi:hypothetical protein
MGKPRTFFYSVGSFAASNSNHAQPEVDFFTTKNKNEGYLVWNIE